MSRIVTVGWILAALLTALPGFVTARARPPSAFGNARTAWGALQATEASLTSLVDDPTADETALASAKELQSYH